jgi:hypothetical protein
MPLLRFKEASKFDYVALYGCCQRTCLGAGSRTAFSAISIGSLLDCRDLCNHAHATPVQSAVDRSTYPKAEALTSAFGFSTASLLTMAYWVAKLTGFAWPQSLRLELAGSNVARFCPAGIPACQLGRT